MIMCDEIEAAGLKGRGNNKYGDYKNLASKIRGPGTEIFDPIVKWWIRTHAQPGYNMSKNNILTL